jgi:hypothetical protein
MSRIIGSFHDCDLQDQAKTFWFFRSRATLVRTAEATSVLS